MSLLNIIQILVGPTVTIVRETKRAISNSLSDAVSSAEARAESRRTKKHPRSVHIPDAAEIAERKRNANEWYEAGRPSDILRGTHDIPSTPDATETSKLTHITGNPIWSAFERSILPYIRLPLMIALIIGIWWLIVSSLAKQ